MDGVDVVKAVGAEPQTWIKTIPRPSLFQVVGILFVSKLTHFFVQTQQKKKCKPDDWKMKVSLASLIVLVVLMVVLFFKDNLGTMDIPVKVLLALAVLLWIISAL
jgi:Na+/phosphate symporter